MVACLHNIKLWLLAMVHGPSTCMYNYVHTYMQILITNNLLANTTNVFNWRGTPTPLGRDTTITIHRFDRIIENILPGDTIRYTARALVAGKTDFKRAGAVIQH